jgi:hypothetical protein
VRRLRRLAGVVTRTIRRRSHHDDSNADPCSFSFMFDNPRCDANSSVASWPWALWAEAAKWVTSHFIPLSRTRLIIFEQVSF